MKKFLYYAAKTVKNIIAMTAPPIPRVKMELIISENVVKIQ